MLRPPLGRINVYKYLPLLRAMDAFNELTSVNPWVEVFIPSTSFNKCVKNGSVLLTGPYVTFYSLMHVILQLSVFSLSF